jgi:hypothetical protein
MPANETGGTGGNGGMCREDEGQMLGGWSGIPNMVSSTISTPYRVSAPCSDPDFWLDAYRPTRDAV